MMTRIYLLVALVFYCASNSALSEPASWLMQGDVLTDEEARSKLVRLDSYKAYLSVNNSTEIYYTAKSDKFISCVIAAAVHMKGYVSVVEGGYESENVRVRYTTENGSPDIFFVLVQAMKRESVNVEEDIAQSARFGIAYEAMRNWTVTEIQDALRNVTSFQFPPS